ncbi:hypothetical protein Leryth_026862 [Lithospermum erythrorhizon]|nr:hypothetical protein Leryth_026862 [Lithospermum erythrorhizon]
MRVHKPPSTDLHPQTPILPHIGIFSVDVVLWLICLHRIFPYKPLKIFKDKLTWPFSGTKIGFLRWLSLLNSRPPLLCSFFFFLELEQTSTSSSSSSLISTNSSEYSKLPSGSGPMSFKTGPISSKASSSSR